MLSMTLSNACGSLIDLQHVPSLLLSDLAVAIQEQELIVVRKFPVIAVNELGDERRGVSPFVAS